MNNWICPKEYMNLKPVNNYYRQCVAKTKIESDIKNLHTLYRKTFGLDSIRVTNISITADDYYMLFVNGKFVTQGPANNYHFEYNINSVDITPYLKKDDDHECVEQITPNVESKIIIAEKIKKLANNYFVLDMGKEIVGQLVIDVQGKKGSKIYTYFS